MLTQDDLAECEAVLEQIHVAQNGILDLAERMKRKGDVDRSVLLKTHGATACEKAYRAVKLLFR